MSKPFSKESFEVVDNGINVGTQFSQQTTYPHSVAESLGFCEHYVNGNVLHVHFAWWTRAQPREPESFCARYQWLSTCGEVAGNGFGDAEPIIEDQNGAVFVDVVELRQDVQGVALGSGGVSLVWLRPLHFCELVDTDKTFQDAVLNSPVFLELSRILKNREDELVDLTNGRAVRASGQSAKQVIESGAQLMNNVSNDDAPSDTLKQLEA